MKKTSWSKRYAMVLTVTLPFALGGLLSSCAVPFESERNVVVYHNYMPPPWAPPYDNVSTIRYYYLPDYDVYYDVWDGTFCYQTGDVWVCSTTLPPMCTDVNLYGVFIVLIDHDISRPWLHDRYYHDNYPPHCYDAYPNIVIHQRIIPDIPRDREIVPRAYNENSDRVTFMQHPREERAMPPNVTPPYNTPLPRAPSPPTPRAPAPGTGRAPAPVPAPAKVIPPNYDRVVQEVPMRAIAPSMPAASKKFNYGSGYAKESKQK